MSSNIDIAIIGGGSAGMSLAANLAKLSPPPNTRVFEPATRESQACHWSLWANEQQATSLRAAVKGRWQRWQLMDTKRRVVHNGGPLSYVSLSSKDYLSHCADQLNDAVQVVPVGVDKVIPCADGQRLQAGEHAYLATHVFDSRPPKVDSNGLLQHFFGYEIRTRAPVTDAGIVTLMDFRVDQSRGLHFIYVLPFSRHHLLVESTMISKTHEPEHWYTTAIEKWLDARGISVSEQLAQEVGSIPMCAVSAQDPALASIGAAGGALRRSSGYAFSYIQRQTTELAARIHAGHYDVPAPISKQIIFMDDLFNRVLIEYPELASNVFMAMASSLTGEQFARFMSGQASVLDWARVVWAMPKRPFLKELLRV